MPSWTVTSIPDQTGRVAIVTGASNGLGTEVAEALAGRGAQVVLAVRDVGRGKVARQRILARYPQADVSISIVDLADLASIRAFAERETTRPAIDLLVNNAGLGMQPVRATTADGFERQFGTNHLGSFALTGLLLPALLRAAAPRVVAVASIAHRTGRIDFADLQGTTRYAGGKAYNQSKLSNLLFALELDRRARHAGSPLVSVAAHPGVATTGFLAAAQLPGWQAKVADFAVGLIGQDAAAGAAPLLYAATMPDVKGGQYWGPDGIMEMRGKPAPAKFASQALDAGVASRLWAESEALTGVRFGALDGG
jgi:NAD(P)-dependent dehydrogenase (short-subunit alcohol dehydrogenase family)